MTIGVDRNNWREGILTDLGTVSRGRSRHRPRNDPILFGGSYPFFQTGDVKKATLWLDNYWATYNDVGLEQSKLWPSRTLCITIAANIADSAILGIPGCFPDSIVGFTVDDSVADVRFVKYMLDHIQQRFQGISRGTTQDNLSLEKLLSVNFRYPPLRAQRKIGTILSTYDDLIENNRRRIKILGEMAQRIYREWFIDFEYPGHDIVPLVESKLGPIPRDWRWVRMGDILEDVRDSVQPSRVEPGTAYLGLEHFPERSIAIQEWGVAFDAKSTKLRYRPSDILFGKIRPYFHKVGRAPVEGICSTDVIVLRPRGEAVASLALAVASSDAFVRHAVQTSQGTKMPRADWKVLREYPVAIPPLELTTRLGLILDDMTAPLRHLVLAIRNLRATRDLLLPQLVSGEIDVEDLNVPMEELAA